MSKRKKSCPVYRGRRYANRRVAEEEILDIKIRSATNGAQAVPAREAQICAGCGGWHIQTVPSRAEP